MVDAPVAALPPQGVNPAPSTARAKPPSVKPSDVAPAPAAQPEKREPQPRAPDASPSPRPAAPGVRPQGSRPVPLNEPLPVVDSILVDQNRRLAFIAGVFVSVGDSVGSRTVTEIEGEFVILREPSGLHVRVAIRGKAPARELSAAVADQRRKSRKAGPVLVPVDVRDWEALFPPEAPASVRAIIQRLRAGEA